MRRTALALSLSLLFSSVLTGCGTMADAWEEGPQFRSLERSAPTLPPPDVPAPSEVIVREADAAQAPDATPASMLPTDAREAETAARNAAADETSSERASEKEVERSKRLVEEAREDELRGLPARVDMSVSGERKTISFRDWEAGKKPRVMEASEAERLEASTYEAEMPLTETVTYGAESAVRAEDLSARTVVATKEAVVGSWREPHPGAVQALRGFDFRTDGSASSVGMGSLRAGSWSLDGSVLTIRGEDAAAGVAIPFVLEFDVIGSDGNTLVIRQGTLVHRFTKR